MFLLLSIAICIVVFLVSFAHNRRNYLHFKESLFEAFFSAFLTGLLLLIVNIYLLYCLSLEHVNFVKTEVKDYYDVDIEIISNKDYENGFYFEVTKPKDNLFNNLLLIGIEDWKFMDRDKLYLIDNKD